MNKETFFIGLTFGVMVSLIVLLPSTDATGSAVEDFIEDVVEEVVENIPKEITGAVVEEIDDTPEEIILENSEPEPQEEAEENETTTRRYFGGGGGGGSGGGGGGSSSSTTTPTPAPEDNSTNQTASNLCITEFDLQTDYPISNYSYAGDTFDLYTVSNNGVELFTLGSGGNLSIIISALESVNYTIVNQTATTSGLTYYEITDLNGFLVEAPSAFAVSPEGNHTNETRAFINSFSVGC